MTSPNIKRIYLAGPLFSMAERRFNLELCTHLEMLGYEVFLPQRDVVATEPGAIFLGDFNGLTSSEAVVAIADGPDQDSGTAWECGFAYGVRMPVVLVRTDFRARGDDTWANLMLSGAADAIVEFDDRSEGGMAQLAEKITKALAEFALPAPEAFA